MKICVVLIILFLLYTACKKSPANPPATVVPSITSISPTQGPPGTVVVITGTNLNVVVGASIDGIEGFFRIDNSSQLELQVPSTAKSGVVAISYQGGSVSYNNSFMVLPPPNLSAPTITNLLPNNNPPSGPVLIQGQNIDSITSITFGNIVAPIDTNFTGVVTTRVPPNIGTGLIELTITGKNGISSTVPFRVLSSYPQFTAAVPPKIVFGPKAPYIIQIPNDWSNNFNTNAITESIFLEIGNSPTGFIGGESINFAYYPLLVTALNTDSQTIELYINRGFDNAGDSINEYYEGTFIGAYPNFSETMLFYNSEGRQVIVSVN